MKKQLVKRLLPLALILFFWSSDCYAQKKTLSENRDIQTPEILENKISNKEDINKYKNKIQYIELCKSIENAIQEEKKNLAELKEEFIQEKNFQKSQEQSFNSYKIQLSSYTNLLGLEITQVKELERIYIASTSVISNIEERIIKLNSSLKSIRQIHFETSERLGTNKKQLLEISIEKESNQLTVTEILVDNIETLTLLLGDKLRLLNKMMSIYNDQIQRNTNLKDSFEIFKDKCRIHIDDKRKKALFQRRSNYSQFMEWKNILNDFNSLLSKWKMLFTSYFWLSNIEDFWITYGIFILISLILFLFMIAILIQCKNLLKRGINRLTTSSEFIWCTFTLHLFTRSVVLIGITLFFIFLSILLYSSVTVIAFAKNVFILFLFTRWILDAASLFMQQKVKSFTISTNVFNKIYYSILSIRISIVLYLFIHLSLEGSGQLISLMRILFEAGVLIAAMIFWNIFFKSQKANISGNRARLIKLRILAIFINSIICATLLIELSGFSELSVYWQYSWARFIIVLMWSFFLLKVIKELNVYTSKKQYSDNIEHNTQQTIKWALIRISFLAWGIISIVTSLLAWGVSLKTIVNLFKILNYPLPVGGLQISLSGCVYSFIILVFTHMIVKIWQSTILKKMLANSGMAKGIQDTVLTITSYSFWVFGIIIALNAIGISTTSLTVAFGALGIGLGFGLQNIFNNFISGLILLFERPVQVGDCVEIDGIWGNIVKINVRSTIVQTFENATLIIPNSEFISNRLVNWSFKDPKVRRTINVHVAYGSDIKKVKEILLDIAAKHPRVYKYPETEVVFSDFGENAQQFELRIWVHIDYTISTRTDIRFEIDRQFQEHNITIPFPQRDIHLYNNNEKIFKEKNTNGKAKNE